MKENQQPKDPKTNKSIEEEAAAFVNSLPKHEANTIYNPGRVETEEVDSSPKRPYPSDGGQLIDINTWRPVKREIPGLDK